MSRDFYELCYDLYKQEMAEAEALYQKASFMLGVVPLLGAIMVTISRIDIIAQCFMRVDIFFFYLASAVATIALIASVFFLFRCICPRQYKTLASMNVWQQWRKNYQDWLDKSETPEGSKTSLDEAMFQNICPKLVDAQQTNVEINESRRLAFKLSVQCSAIAMVAIGLQGVFAILLKLQGV